MELYEAIRTRRDIRRFQKGAALPDAALRRILEAAHHAPSVGFSQPWRFLLIRDPQTRTAVRALFEDANREARRAYEGERQALYDSLKLEGITESALNLCGALRPARRGARCSARSRAPHMTVAEHLPGDPEPVARGARRGHRGRMGQHRRSRGAACGCSRSPTSVDHRWLFLRRRAGIVGRSSRCSSAWVGRTRRSLDASDPRGDGCSEASRARG